MSHPPPLVLMDYVGPALGAVVFVLLMSQLKEPTRRTVNAMLAAGGLPRLAQTGWIVLCMVSARSAAMAFNRLADAQIDAANPRTATRAIPAGTLSMRFVATFILVSCGIFVLAASQLNRLTLILSPIALGVILLYSYTKRFTRWSHVVLGFALGIAPAAAWIRTYSPEASFPK